MWYIESVLVAWAAYLQETNWSEQFFNLVANENVLT